MRPKDLPDGSTRPHGTRSRYVSGCRCKDCRAANVKRYHQQQRKAKRAALDLPVSLEYFTTPAPQLWTAPDGSKRTRYYKRACPGVNGSPCPNKSHLRSDSVGNVCARCREMLIWNGLVDAKPARDHLLKLRRAGVGRRNVEANSGVAASIIQKIILGQKTRIRADTERRLLAVDKNARNGSKQLVQAAPTWKRIKQLLREGFTRRELARRLGSKARNPQLQCRKTFVTAATEAKVRRLHSIITNA